MFTGIVEELGYLQAKEPVAAGYQLTIGATEVLVDAKIGDSIAVNGTCLTVVEVGSDYFVVDTMAETLRATALADLAMGAPVNLERAMLANGRFSGHVVQGHVDAVGVIREREVAQNATMIWLDLPTEALRYCVTKGSITIDGISLTIAALDEAGLSVAIIPHTWQVTNLSSRRVGDRVNIEVDVIAKYVERLVGPQLQSSQQPSGLLQPSQDSQ